MVNAVVNEIGNSIIVVKPDGSCDFKIELQPYFPFDITYIPDDNTIAVTSNDCNDIKIVDVYTRKVLKTFSVFSLCAGITYSNGKLMFCSMKNRILELNQSDGSVKTIVFGEISENSHITTFEDMIYFTNTDNHSITCCDLSGRMHWTFQNRGIYHPVGVTVDTDGNVFVASNNSHKVFVISPDGQQHKQLLSPKDCVQYPNGLMYDRDNNRLLVTSHHEGAVLYRVT